MEDKDISRRTFITGATGAVAASMTGVACRSGRARPAKRRTGRSTVVLVRDPEVLDKRGRVRAKVIADMLDRAVCALTGKKTPQEAFTQLLKPTDILGIKSNVWNYLRTPLELERALSHRARGVGIDGKRIHVDDRGARSSLKSCTALINARPLRSHHWSGIGGCIKNYIMFVRLPWMYHGDSCADLGAIWNEPIVRGKTRLNVLVMLTPLFHGRGPHHYNPKYVWPYRGLLVSTDPVAADAVGLEILKAKRREAFGRERPFVTKTKHVQLADTRHGVGISDLKRIKLIKLGDTRDLLLPGG